MSKMLLGYYTVFVCNLKTMIPSMVDNSDKEMEESLLIFHIATWGILLNRHKHTNLVALTQLIQYHTKTDNVTTKGKAIDNISKRNQVAVMQLCSMLHRTIKRRGAVFLPSETVCCSVLKFFIVKSLICLLKSGIKGISNRKIRELITCVYSLSILGIHIEMTEDLSGYEIIVFGGMIDLDQK